MSQLIAQYQTTDSPLMKIVTFGEIMMRLSTPGFARFAQAEQFSVRFGGGEANTGIALAQWGIEATHVTRLPDHDIGRMVTAYLRKCGVGTQHIAYGGDRLGLFFLETGAAMRSTKIVYDRFDSAFATLSASDFDWETILQGADWFHWTGITPAISAGAAEACLQAIQTANRLGVKVSGDVNYRRNLWRYGKTVQEVMPELVAGCDVIVCGKGDATDIFGIVPDKQSGDSGFVSCCKQIQGRFPRVKQIITTKRGQLSASHNTLTGRCWNGTDYLETTEVNIPDIVDRVGGGDAFVAGYIYGMLVHQDVRKALDFGVAASALKHTVEGDAALVSVAEVEAVIKGEVGGRIAR